MDMNRKRELENQLNNLYDKKAQGAQIRSSAKWVSDGEKIKNNENIQGFKANFMEKIYNMPTT